MRKLIAALAIMLAAIPFKTFAGFVSWEDGMTVAPRRESRRKRDEKFGK